MNDKNYFRLCASCVFMAMAYCVQRKMIAELWFLAGAIAFSVFRNGTETLLEWDGISSMVLVAEVGFTLSLREMHLLVLSTGILYFLKTWDRNGEVMQNRKELVFLTCLLFLFSMAIHSWYGVELALCTAVPEVFCLLQKRYGTECRHV